MLGEDFIFLKDLKSSAVISIHTKYLNLILESKKVFEYRNFIPKKHNGYFWVYETSPTKELKYIMKVGKAIVFPDKINIDTYGSARFNSGEMKCKYAYPILEIYELNCDLSYSVLKQHRFVPPQAFSYMDTYPELFKYIIDYGFISSKGIINEFL